MTDREIIAAVLRDLPVAVLCLVALIAVMALMIVTVG